MAQAGYTPIQLYYSSTASAAPSAGDLTSGELAINIADGIIFYKTPGGAVTPIANATATAYLAGLTGNVQTQLDGLQGQISAKGAIAGQTWTGTHVFPATTSIGNVSATELSYLDGVTSPIQTQFGDKGSVGGQVWTGTHDFTGASVTVAAPSAANSPVTKYYADGLSFATALPDQTGNAGKVVTTDGTTASWGVVASATVTDFSSSGSYAEPDGATFVEVWGWGAGGGGASGRRGAVGTLRTGGGGGGGGALVIRRFKVSELVFPVTVTIGAGGTGGAAITANDTSGNGGSVGGNSTFGSYVTAFGGGGGAAGAAAANAGGGGGGGSGAGSASTGGTPLITFAAGTTQQFGGGGGGPSSATGKNSVYGGGGGGNCDTTNEAAGTSIYAAGGGAGGASINTSNQLVVTQAAGGTNYAASPNTSFPWAVNGAAGSAYTGGQGGSAVVAATSIGFQQVAYGASKFLALGVGNLFSTSANGTTGWDVGLIPVPTATFIASNVLHDGSKWVFYSAGVIYTSTDLVNFTAATAPGISVNNIAYAGGLYVAVGNSGAISTSPDLITWTARTSGTAQALNAVTYNGTKWIAVGNSGVTLTSTDAVTWVLVTAGGGVPSFYSVAANGATLVVHSNATPFAHYSTDTGATWTAVATTMATGSSGTGNKQLIYAGGRFVLISGSVLYTSTDGNTWTLQTDGTADSYSGIAHDGTTYVVGSSNSNSNVGITSTDAVTWTARTFTDGRTLVYGNGGAGGIAAGGGGGAASLNGTNSGAGAAGGNGFIRVYSW